LLNTGEQCDRLKQCLRCHSVLPLPGDGNLRTRARGDASGRALWPLSVREKRGGSEHFGDADGVLSDMEPTLDT
jgi:hypothetical protein